MNRVRAGLSALCLLLVAGCSDSRARVVHADGGDASTRDAVVPDGGTDAPVPADAAPDAPLDAPADTSVPPSWSGWQLMPPPNECQVYRADDASAVVPALTWKSCPGIAGCTAMDAPWLGKANHAFWSAGFTKYNGRELLFLVEQQSQDRFVAVLYDVAHGGKALQAYGEDYDSGVCESFDAFDGDRILLNFLNTPDKTNVRYDFFYGSADSPSTFAAPAWSGLAPGGGYPGINRIALAKSFMAIESGGPGMALVDLTTHKLSGFTTPGLTAPLVHPVAVGDDLFFTAESSPGTGWVRRADGTVVELRHLAGVEVGGWTADSNSLAWTELTKPDPNNYGHYLDSSLWTAPYTIDPAKLAPRRLDTLFHDWFLATDMLLGAGYVAVGGDDTIRIYRLSDGSYYELPPAPLPGLAWYQPLLWMDSEEFIGVAAWKGNPRSVIRMKLADLTLHPPDP